MCSPSSGCSFSRFRQALREVFIGHHAELLTAAWWRAQSAQATHAAESEAEAESARSAAELPQRAPESAPAA